MVGKIVAISRYVSSSWWTFGLFYVWTHWSLFNEVALGAILMLVTLALGYPTFS